MVASEHVGVRLRIDKGLEVVLELSLEVGWDGNAATTRVRFGGSSQQLPVHINDLLSDLYPPVEHVQVGPPQ